MSTETDTPKKSFLTRLAEAAENAKPSNLDDEKRETVRNRIKFTGAFVAGVLTTVTVVVTAAYYNSIPTVEDETFEDIDSND